MEFRIKSDVRFRAGALPLVQDQWGKPAPIEIEAIDQIIRVLVSLGQRIEIKSFLDELQHRRKLKRRMRDVTRLYPRRDDQEGNAGTEPKIVHDGRRDMVVKAPEIIPGQKHDRGFPICALHDRIKLLNSPVLTQANAGRRVLTEPRLEVNAPATSSLDDVRQPGASVTEEETQHLPESRRSATGTDRE